MIDAISIIRILIFHHQHIDVIKACVDIPGWSGRQRHARQRAGPHPLPPAQSVHTPGCLLVDNGSWMWTMVNANTVDKVESQVVEWKQCLTKGVIMYKPGQHLPDAQTDDQVIRKRKLTIRFKDKLWDGSTKMFVFCFDCTWLRLPNRCCFKVNVFRKQDYQRWRYHSRLLDYQSPYFQLKFPLDRQIPLDH